MVDVTRRQEPVRATVFFTSQFMWQIDTNFIVATREYGIQDGTPTTDLDGNVLEYYQCPELPRKFALELIRLVPADHVLCRVGPDFAVVTANTYSVDEATHLLHNFERIQLGLKHAAMDYGLQYGDVL